ncbi:hypothetical protein Q4534_16205 [Cyclobacterium sp. 1_MG-2023]|uniref:hypothetical protein n=1 Tax=Cyclobacterium sp. 1_MG-2023 TaxID=3062681 RepID=UPI0026E2FDE5|nr:hypothetical protein [Cyclobacterium sp. 1_MG-2023]MDO6438966.1 hypothetical protein [Cyclobacterium sp. 1_MG-2023]
METQNWKNNRKQITKNLAVWTSFWLITLALVTFGHQFLWDENPLFTWIGFLVNLFFAGGLLLANIRFLKSLDELEKQIQLEAMGIALGVGVFGGISFNLMDNTNLIPVDAEISFLVIAISLTYMAAIAIGKKRYQ